MSIKRTSVFAANPATTRGSATRLSAHKDQVVYANGRTIVIRDLNNASNTKLYAAHTAATTVARISPSGYYCASADVQGNVKVWDTVGEEQTLKGEYKILSGQINDLAWDGESKRIIAGGDGREKFGHAFMMDTGSSSGEITGHSKLINAVSIRHQRPFRAATAGDDGLIVFHQGVPFKYDKIIKTHTKFVQDVRFSPSGDHFASVGSDFKAFLYDGKTGDELGGFTDSAHTGTIYAVAWGQDSRQLATSSADKTVKLWDIETKKNITTWNLGTGIEHQQVGNTWSETQGIVSLSVSGDLNLFDARVGDRPSRTLKGPQKAVNGLAVTKAGTFLTGSAEGRIVSFDPSTGDAEYLEGTGHNALVSGLASSVDGTIYSVGYDDHAREITSDGKGFVPTVIPTASQPRSVAITDSSIVLVAEVSGIEVFKSNQRVQQLTLPGTSALSATAINNLVAFGAEDKKVYLYEWDGAALKQTAVLADNHAPVTAVAFSPDGKYLAAGESSGKILLYNAEEKKLITGRWSFHAAKINSLAWTPDSRHCASGSLDGHIYVWSVASPLKNIAAKHAVIGGVHAVAWLPDGTDAKKGRLVGAGADVSPRVWEVTFHNA